MMKLLSLLLPMCLARPDWCKWVPVGSMQSVGECNVAPTQTQLNQTSTGCAGWCGWSAVASWQYIPECLTCSPDVQHTETAVLSPANCTYWCQWVSRPAWQNVGACTGCEAIVKAPIANANNYRPVVPETKQTEETAGRSPKLKVKMGQPDWCKWVPVGYFQYVGECNVAPTQAQVNQTSTGCAGWCGWSAVASWQYIPECLTCSPDAQPAETTVISPANCTYWCQWVSRPAWQNVGACTGCETIVKAPIANANNYRPILP